MVVYVKNPRLKARVFKTLRRLENMAMKAFSKGKMAQGKKYDHKADRLYKKYYHQIFGIR